MQIDETKNALDMLGGFKKKMLILKRPVFFVPGWTGEDCSCWTKSMQEKGQPERLSAKAWLGQIFSNPDKLYFIDFTEVMNSCESFLDFGTALKERVWRDIGKDQEFDIIGHSMGGLDIRAAITQDDPLLNCRKCITVATPEQGSQLGGISNALLKTFLKPLVLFFKPMTPMQAEQSLYLDPDHSAMQEINSPNKVQLFFNRIDKLCQLKGTLDNTVMDSAYLKLVGSELSFENKIESIAVSSCDHTSTRIGITTDPRTITAIALKLCDMPVPGPEANLGVYPGGNYKPQDESKRIV